MDIVERLRELDNWVADTSKEYDGLIGDAADEIERLRKALAQVDDAIKKYADVNPFSHMTTLGRVQKIARSALQQKESK